MDARSGLQRRHASPTEITISSLPGLLYCVRDVEEPRRIRRGPVRRPSPRRAADTAASNHGPCSVSPSAACATECLCRSKICYSNSGVPAAGADAEGWPLSFGLPRGRHEGNRPGNVEDFVFKAALSRMTLSQGRHAFPTAIHWLPGGLLLAPTSLGLLCRWGDRGSREIKLSQPGLRKTAASGNQVVVGCGVK